MSYHGSPSLRFVVAAPEGRDSELICDLLEHAGYLCEAVESVTALGQVPVSELLALVVTDEALTNGRLDILRLLIQAQPGWSDLPIVLLTGGTGSSGGSLLAARARAAFHSLVLLERPVRKDLLLAALQSAFHSRMKQLEVRDAMVRQGQADEALRQTEKLAATGRLAATIVHEVNNPLEAISNLLFLIEQTSSLEEAHTFSRAALQEIRQASEIIRHTLNFHRGTVRTGPTDVADLVRSALALFRGRMKQRGIVHEVHARTTLANCSPGEIRQVLVNLIGNAVDAMPSGGRLWVRVSPFRLGAENFARMTVVDTGCGISDEIRSRLFTQFFTTKGSQGTGIGLWLTRDIVLKNRGSLRFRSRTAAPTGTAFSVWLPVHPERAAAQQGFSTPAA